MVSTRTYLLLAAVMAFMAGTPLLSAQNIVANDGTNTTFDASELGQPVIDGAIQAIIMGAGLVLLSAVVAWIFKYIRKK